MPPRRRTETPEDPGRRSIVVKAVAGRGLWPGRVPMGGVLIAVAALSGLALGSTWLLQRDAVREARAHAAARARAQAELVAQATLETGSWTDTARLVRILECTTRDGGVSAAAIVDSTGQVIAHTDVALLGARIALPSPGDAETPARAEENWARLFRTPGPLVMQPLIGPRGAQGMAVLLLPEERAQLLNASALRVLLPSVLLLLAFVGVVLATIRWAVRPTAEFLEHLARAFECEETELRESPAGPPQPDAALEQAVRSVEALHDEKRALLVQNRLLVYEKKRLARMLDRLPEGMLLTDQSGHLIWRNRAAAQWCDQSATEGGEPGTGELPPALRDALEEARRTGRGEARMEGNDGRGVRVTRLPLAGAQELAAGELYLLRDDSAQQAAQHAQAEFIAQISHELKAPLNTIVTLVEAMADEDDLPAEERRAYFNTLNDEAMRMARLIGNLMQISRIELGNLSADFRYLKPAPLVAQQAEALRAQAEQRGLALEVAVPENLPALYGDKDLLGVALTNLLTNAIKYTPEGGRVAVRAAVAGEGVAIEIEDTGIGIPPEEQEHVFERFARSPQAEVQTQPGTGLGLALVREIAEIHEGRVELASEVGRGSRFRLWLPCRQVGTRMDVAAA